MSVHSPLGMVSGDRSTKSVLSLDRETQFTVASCQNPIQLFPNDRMPASFLQFLTATASVGSKVNRGSYVFGPITPTTSKAHRVTSRSASSRTKAIPVLSGLKSSSINGQSYC